MKLDPKIIEGKRPLTCFDAEEAKQFIGKEGYFANCLRVFKTIEYFEKWTLTAVDEKEERCFKDATGGNYWNHFLPAEWVKETEWRPYLIDEWLQEHNFGDVIEFRTKTNHCEITAMFIGMDSEPQNGKTRIMLGCNAYSFDSLFEHYELIDKTHDGKFAWRSFGIEVKE